jgi:hypothetical protein
MTAVTQTVRPPVEVRDTRLERARRMGLALACLVAPWGFVITNAGYAWAIRNGASDETGAGALALSAANPGLTHLIVLAGMLGSLLIVPATLAAMRVARTSWLAFVGGTLMAAGYICYFAVLSSSTMVLAMALHGGPQADFAAAIDAGQQDPFATWVFLLFVAGNLLGTLLLAIGLLRSRTVPVWAALAIMVWPPLHVTGLVVGSEWFEVTGAVFQGLGFAGVATVVLGGPWKASRR